MVQFHIYNRLVILRKLKIYILEQQQFLGWVVNVVLAIKIILSKDVPTIFRNAKKSAAPVFPDEN